MRFSVNRPFTAAACMLLFACGSSTQAQNHGLKDAANAPEWVVRDVRASGIGIVTPSVDIATARIEFASGAVANLTASRMARDRVRKLRIFQQIR